MEHRMTKEDKRFFVKLFVESKCKDETWISDGGEYISYKLPKGYGTTNNFQMAVDFWMEFLEED